MVFPPQDLAERAGRAGLPAGANEVQDGSLHLLTPRNHVRLPCTWHQNEANFLLLLLKSFSATSNGVVVRGVELQLKKWSPIDLEGRRQLRSH